MTHSDLPAIPPVEAVSADVALHCVDQLGRPLAFMSTWAYSSLDPYAVAVTFHVPAGDVDWLLGRALLREGSVGPAGVGDVFLVPTHDEEGRAVLAMEFRTDVGRLSVQAARADVDRFLSATYAVVPEGREADHVDLEAGLAALLRGGV